MPEETARPTTRPIGGKHLFSAAEVVQELQSARKAMLGAVVFLCLLGLMMVYSASWGRTADWYGMRFLLRQLVWLGVGAMAAFTAFRIDYRRLVRLKWLVLLGTLGILVLVLIVGARINGARRWFRFGSIGIQASEFAKVGLVLFLASFTAGRADVLRRFWTGFVPGVFFVGAGFALIAAEPDLGMALLWATVGGLILFSAGARLWHCILAALMASPGIVLLVIYKMPYILARLRAFLDPANEASGKGYQAAQSVLALAMGGILPDRVGGSIQKMGFLPEPHTDFIFAILGEELGLVGTLAVIGCFIFVVYQGLRISFWARDSVGHLIALGATAFVGLQAGINIGVVTAALPTKGMALPFLSYGGSNLVTSLVLIGLIGGVARRAERDMRELPPTASFTVLPTEVWPAPQPLGAEA